MRRSWAVVFLGCGMLLATDRFAAAALIDLFSLDRSDEKSQIIMLQVPFFTFLEAAMEGSDYSVKFVEAPFLTVFEREKNSEESTWDLLEIPFITVLSMETTEATTHQKILTLPIVGSLYGYDRDENGSKLELLFFIHRRTQD